MKRLTRRCARNGVLIATCFALSPIADACTRMFWNTIDGIKIVGRNEDYVTASHPTLVATPRGVERHGTADKSKRANSLSWIVKYGNIATYANNRFPNDGMNEMGLTARTLFYVDGDPNQIAAPDSKNKQLDEDHWVSYVLDNFSSVAEAVAAFKEGIYLVSVTGSKGSGFSYATPKHLAMADSTGDSAILEIQNGKLKIFHGEQYRILTNPPSYQEELDDVIKFQNVAQEQLPVSWSGADRFVRADYFLRHLPKPINNDAQTAYGFMYSALATTVMPAGLPSPAEDIEIIDKLVATLTDPNETYGGAATYFQSISDLTNKHYRFKSLMAPSDVFFNFKGYDFSKGQPVKVIKRIDQYAQQGWSGNVTPHLVNITGDIYSQSIE
ncbi:choloylglycine hydrolase [Psychromonas marina]|uniref:Choloylglycine hydrolase n=1 Tax=Psychromonas marina TaxID=88364 RepID=A0ABQ6E5C7_9GAMM|nr:linear amide C-N hydrolase [Psychromonas marina]GLS92454.1 choloylglycine hydrolase [Psychromonas marina]